MPAHQIYDSAPLGSFISFLDDAPAPPREDANAFESWRRRNGFGLLIRKDPPPEQRNCGSPASITLRILYFRGDRHGDDEHDRTFPLDCDLGFELIERPEIGMFRVLRDIGGNVELLRVAVDLADAEHLRSRFPHVPVLIEEITADEHAADAVEGRCPSERPAVRRPACASRARG